MPDAAGGIIVMRMTQSLVRSAVFSIQAGIVVLWCAMNTGCQPNASVEDFKLPIQSAVLLQVTHIDGSGTRHEHVIRDPGALRRIAESVRSRGSIHSGEDLVGRGGFRFECVARQPNGQEFHFVVAGGILDFWKGETRYQAGGDGQLVYDAVMREVQDQTREDGTRLDLIVPTVLA